MIKEYGIKDWNSFIQTINGLTWSLARELGPECGIADRQIMSGG